MKNQTAYSFWGAVPHSPCFSDVLLDLTLLSECIRFIHANSCTVMSYVS